MLKVTLDLRCNVCGGVQFLLPTSSEASGEIRCAACSAFKCKDSDLERVMAEQQQKSAMAAVA